MVGALSPVEPVMVGGVFFEMLLCGAASFAEAGAVSIGLVRRASLVGFRHVGRIGTS